MIKKLQNWNRLINFIYHWYQTNKTEKFTITVGEKGFSIVAEKEPRQIITFNK